MAIEIPAFTGASSELEKQTRQGKKLFAPEAEPETGFRCLFFFFFKVKGLCSLAHDCKAGQTLDFHLHRPALSRHRIHQVSPTLRW